MSSSIAYLSFGRAASAVGSYAQLVTNSAIFRDIDLQVTQYRAHVREFVFSGDEATAATAIKDGEVLRQLIAGGLTRITNPERHRLLQDAAKQAELYATNFENEHAMIALQAKLETEELDAVGRQMTDGFSALMTGAIALSNGSLQALAADGRKLSLMSRLDAYKGLGRHDATAVKQVEAECAGLAQVLSLLDAAVDDKDLTATVKNEGALLDRYQTAFRRAASLDADKVTLMNGAMRQAGVTLAEDAKQGERQQRRGAGGDREGCDGGHGNRRNDGHGAGGGRLDPGRRVCVVDRPRHREAGGCACVRRCVRSPAATRRSRSRAWAARMRSVRWPAPCRCSRTT